MALDYLSDIERAEVLKFNQNTLLKNVIRKVLLEAIYNNGVLRKDVAPDPSRNAALSLAFLATGGNGVVSNSDLGEDIRALAQGVRLVEQGLAQLDKIKSKQKEEPEPQGNPGV